MFLHYSRWQIFLRWVVVVDLGIMYSYFISSWYVFSITLTLHVVISSQSVYNWSTCFIDSLYLANPVIWIWFILSTRGLFSMLILLCWWDSYLMIRFLVILEWTLWLEESELMVELFWMTSMKWGMMICLAFNCVVKLGMLLKCIDIKMPDGVKKFSLWRLCWSFLWWGSRYWMTWKLWAILFLFSIACLCLWNDENYSEHAHNRHTRRREV